MSAEPTSGPPREAVSPTAAEPGDHERGMLADLEEFAGAGSFEWEIMTGRVIWSSGMYRIRGVEIGGERTLEQADGVDPRDRDRVRQSLDEALAGEAAVVDLTYRIVRPDGDVRWLETRNRIERDGEARAVRLRGTSIDVTARRESDRLREEAEQTGRARERLLRSVVDNNMALIYVKDLDGRYLLYNRRFAEALALDERAAAEGIPADRVLLGRNDSWLDPARSAAWRVNDLRAREGPHQAEEFSHHPSRGRLSFDSIKFPLLDDDGSAYATCGVSLETTQRTLEREQLAEAARYFDLSRDLMVALSFDGYFKTVNPALEHVLGWSPEEFLGRPFIDLVHPDDRAATLREVKKLADGEVTLNFVNRYEAKDGSFRWLDWNAIAPAGEGLIYAAGRDVTGRRTAEAAVEASERQTREILETAHDVFVSFDQQGLTTGWNHQAEVVFGWSREETLGRELAAIVIPEGRRDRHRRGIEQLLATGQGDVLGRRLERIFVRRDGTELPVELTMSSVETVDGYSFNLFLQDITDRKRAEAELALARDQALEASRMKSMFVANVSHEIRTPMNGVIGMTELLIDTSLDDQQRGYAETISSSGQALLEIIDDILDYSKIEAGKLELDPTDFDLHEVLERTCGMLAARAHAKGLELIVDVDPEVPAMMRGDAARLRQVIANFVSNAIKFTAAGEVVVRASSSADANAALVRVEVSDTGIGIERDALDQLFKPFSQADTSTTRKYGGTGLGLAISRQLIELMGGVLGGDSESGTGSRFWFELSLEIVEPPEDRHVEELTLPGVRVLVVDDNATSRGLLARQLGRQRITCELAASAARALELLDRAASAGTGFAVAVLDLDMPGGDGDRLARTIRATPGLGGMRLVGLTSSGSRADPPEDETFDGLVAKPVRESRLHHEIAAVIAGDRRPARRIRTAASPIVGARPSASSPVILVVEDTPVNQAVAVHMLERCGYRADVAENGREALSVLARRPYAAVLMDCQMPELDGYATTREIRRGEPAGRRLPIIAMTANSMHGERERCLVAGMDDYLCKPLRTRDLKDALARLVLEPPAGPQGTGAATSATGAVAGSGAAGGRGAVDGNGAVDGSGVERFLDEAVIGEIENVDGDLLTQLVSLYFEQTAGILAELADSIRRGETLAAAEAAHKLKGGSLTLGAEYVSRLALELEASARAGDLPAARDLLDRLGPGLEQTFTAFHARSGRTGRPEALCRTE